MDILKTVSGLPYSDNSLVIPPMAEFKRKCNNITRRKSCKAYLIGFSNCGLFAIWQSALHGNTWAMSYKEAMVK